MTNAKTHGQTPYATTPFLEWIHYITFSAFVNRYYACCFALGTKMPFFSRPSVTCIIIRTAPLNYAVYTFRPRSHSYACTSPQDAPVDAILRLYGYSPRACAAPSAKTPAAIKNTVGHCCWNVSDRVNAHIASSHPGLSIPIASTHTHSHIFF